MDSKDKRAAGAASVVDSLQLIARDAATYAEGAGEPEFSQFLNIEARILAMVRVKASLEPCTNILADALERAYRHFDEGLHGARPSENVIKLGADIRDALMVAGRINTDAAEPPEKIP